VEVAAGTGNIHIAGAFFGTIALNGFTATAAPFSIWVMKLDEALTCQWLSIGGGNSSTYGSYPRGLAIDAAENSYITGNASGALVTFGPHSFTGNSESDDEVFVVKYNSGGEAQWLRHGGSIRNDGAFDIIADAQGNTVITGLLGGNIPFAEFDGIQVDIVSQSTHCFIARYDANGQIIYAERLGGGSDDVGSGLALANDSTFFLTGTTWGSTPWLNWNFQSCCLDPNLFIAKFSDTFNDPSTGIPDPERTSAIIYPNPATDRITVRGLKGNPRSMITDSMGRPVCGVSANATIDVSNWPDGLYIARSAEHRVPFVVAH
jgi:hypothetical protein